jgi:hypothetical protein
VKSGVTHSWDWASPYLIINCEREQVVFNVDRVLEENIEDYFRNVVSCLNSTETCLAYM